MNENTLIESESFSNRKELRLSLEILTQSVRDTAINLTRHVSNDRLISA